MIVGTTLIVVPSVTSSYFIRAEGICNTTSCLSITINVNDSSFTAISISAMHNSICPGNSATLNVTGGNLGTAANWFWYSGSCAGTPESTGQVITVAPIIITMYFVRAESLCNSTACVSITITVNDSSVTSTGIFANNLVISNGGSSTLSAQGGYLGTGAQWYWYSGSCTGGVFEGSGNSIVVSPTTVTVYFVRAEGLCNTTTCNSIQINILLGYTISGHVNYDNTASTPMDSLKVYLTHNHVVIDSTLTDSAGYYLF